MVVREHQLAIVRACVAASGVLSAEADRSARAGETAAAPRCWDAYISSSGAASRCG